MFRYSSYENNQNVRFSNVILPNKIPEAVDKKNLCIPKTFINLSNKLYDKCIN